MSQGSWRGEGAALLDHDRGEAAGGDHLHRRRARYAELVDHPGHDARRPGWRSRRRPRTAAPRRCSWRSPCAGRSSSTLRSCAPRRPSASSEMSMPGAIAPPTYSPRALTTSKVVAVPKSTTIAGAAVEGGRGERVDDPVGADLAGVVHQYGHAGAHPRLDDDARHVAEVVARASRATRAAPRARSRTPRSPATRSRDRCLAQQAADQHRPLVGGAPLVGGHPPVVERPRRRRAGRARCGELPMSAQSRVTSSPAGPARGRRRAPSGSARRPR